MNSIVNMKTPSIGFSVQEQFYQLSPTTRKIILIATAILVCVSLALLCLPSLRDKIWECQSSIDDSEYLKTVVEKWKDAVMQNHVVPNQDPTIEANDRLAISQSVVTLSSIKEFIENKKEVLVLTFNHLPVFPSNIFSAASFRTNLNRLEISCQHLQELPESLGNCRNLKELTLKDCLVLKDLKAIDLKSLKALTFQNCPKLTAHDLLSLSPRLPSKCTVYYDNKTLVNEMEEKQKLDTSGSKVVFRFLETA